VVSEDRYAQGIQEFLCCFYTSRVKLSIIDTTSDVDSAKLGHFRRRHVRFDSVNLLYR
ncbi:hypothetical protein M378DRAFT_58859, partial [Amanita muscaria Koide BX008]